MCPPGLPLSEHLVGMADPQISTRHPVCLHLQLPFPLFLVFCTLCCPFSFIFFFSFPYTQQHLALSDHSIEHLVKQ